MSLMEAAVQVQILYKAVFNSESDTIHRKGMYTTTLPLLIHD